MNMGKAKLKDLVETLEAMRSDYVSTHKTEPFVWDLETHGGKLESIELCHGIKDGKLGTTCKSTEIYNFFNYGYGE